MAPSLGEVGGLGQLGAGLAALLGVSVEQIVALERLSGGASQETWAFDVRHAGGKVEPLILRRCPPGRSGRVELSAGLGAEARLIALSSAHGVPVPALRRELRVEDGLGEGFIVERLPGQALGRRIAAASEFATVRQGLARRCGEVLAAIHALPRAEVPAALRVAAPRQELDNYRAWHARHGTARPVFQLAFRWLADHSSTAPLELTLVHGDFRNGNLLVHPERGLVAVLDWELAHVGDPVSDLGWMCVNSWRYGERGKVVGGFGDVAGLLEGYRSAGGREVDAQHLFWWQVMGTLKWGVICESMVHAWLVGEDDQIERAAVGRRASEAEIDLLELLAPGARAVR